MNENVENFSYKLNKKQCLTCLSTTNLYSMSCEFIYEYSKFVAEVNVKECSMMICNLCSRMFDRFLRFKRQCQIAKSLLQDAAEMGSKSMLLVETLTSNWKQSLVEVHSYPEITVGDGTQCTLSQLGNGFANSDNMCNSTEEFEVNDGNNYSEDDEELPLLLLKSRRKKEGKKETAPKKEIEELEPVSENTVKCKRKEKKSKIKKELKAGFTSRMVQETQEYVVIKLTRDEVLSEMSERAKSESYQRYPFKCEKCIKGFNFQDVLQTHLEKHTAEKGSFQCDMCFQYCPSAVSLRGHIKSHTTRYKCKLCDHVRLSRQHLLEHHATQHTEHPACYSCNTCSFNTDKRTVIQRHVRRHAACTPRACDTCGKLFQSIHSLRVHAMRHDVSSRLQCPQCPRSFVYASLLRRHARSVHERRDYYCVECDLQFRSQESLRLHFKKAVKHRDSSTYKFVCTECPQRFFSRSALAAHLSAAHAAPRAHACAACRRRYCSRDALRSHVWRAHRATPDKSKLFCQENDVLLSIKG